jgi:2-isopropylmalate synthase
MLITLSAIIRGNQMNSGKRICVLDTTLRDGDQAPGFAFSFAEKLRVALLLEKLGVDIIEAGFPVSSKADFESVCAIGGMIENAAVSAMARTVIPDILLAAKAIKHAKRKMIHLSIATSSLHREYKLKMTRMQVIKNAVEAVLCARHYSDIVEIGAEDAVRTEHEFLLEFCIAVTESGADTVNISDTVGYSQPSEFAHLIRFLMTNVPGFKTGSSKLSVHCHNDLGLASANTLAGIEAGALQIETTLLGVGERAGNTSIEEIIAALESRADYFAGAYTGIRHELLAESVRTFSRIIGIPSAPNKPVTGRNAFSHASGIHQSGMIANPRTYSLLPAEFFGIKGSRFVMTRHSGSSGLSHFVQGIIGKKLEKEQLSALYEKFKEREVLSRSVPFTDFVFFLKEEGLYSSEIWRVSLCEYSAGEDRTQRFKVEFDSDSGNKLICEHRLYPDFSTLIEKLNALFGIHANILEFSFTCAGNISETGGRFYLHSSVNDHSYYSERFGTDSFRLAAEAYIDIVNAVHSATHPEAV